MKKLFTNNSIHEGYRTQEGQEVSIRTLDFAGQLWVFFIIIRFIILLYIYIYIFIEVAYYVWLYSPFILYVSDTLQNCTLLMRIYSGIGGGN